jgi:hypothetical protein
LADGSELADNSEAPSASPRRQLPPSTSKPTEVTCEPKAFVVQATQLLELAPSQPRPSAKERGEAGVPSRPLHYEVVVIQRAKVGGKIFH